MPTAHRETRRPTPQEPHAQSGRRLVDPQAPHARFQLDVVITLRHALR
jgi:hypothetical protein